MLWSHFEIYLLKKKTIFYMGLFVFTDNRHDFFKYFEIILLILRLMFFVINST